jgi:hypothetical protein
MKEQFRYSRIINKLSLNLSLVKVSIKMNTGYLSAAEWPLLPVSEYTVHMNSFPSVALSNMYNSIVSNVNILARIPPVIQHTRPYFEIPIFSMGGMNAVN